MELAVGRRRRRFFPGWFLDVQSRRHVGAPWARAAWANEEAGQKLQAPMSKHQCPSTNEAPNSMVQHPRETEEGRRRLKRICLVLTFHSGRGLAPETGALRGVGLGSEGEIVLGGLHGRTVMGRVRPSRSGPEGFLEANPTINHGAIVGHPSRIKTRKKAGIFEQEVTEETEGEDGPKAKSPSQKDVCPIAAGWSGPSGPIHAPLHAPHR